MHCISCGAEAQPEAKFCHACGKDMEAAASPDSPDSPVSGALSGPPDAASSGTLPPAKNEAEAVKWTRKAAEQGHALGQHLLGVMYANGEGVAQDEMEAVKWFRTAVEQGYADAQYSLGEMFASGRGVAQDETEAVKWYRTAAEQGHADAQFKLGVMYENGRGVAKDGMEAIKWYRKVIDQGDATAQYKGVMYENARDTARDEAQAVPVKPDDSGAPADMVENEEEDISAEPDSDAGPSTEERLSARTVETKTGTARKFIIGIVLVGLAVYAFNTYVQASFDLGESYYKARNYPAAVEQFRMAAYLGNADAQFKLGAMYEDGRGVEQDKEEAVEWYQKAADQGDAVAQFALGMKYYAGEGVEKDVTEACRWFRKAAAQGDALAQYALGMRHYAGEGVEKDDTQAYMWVILALSNTASVSPDYLPRVEFRDSLAARLTSGQRDKAQRLALEWQQQHAR